MARQASTKEIEEKSFDKKSWLNFFNELSELNMLLELLSNLETLSSFLRFEMFEFWWERFEMKDEALIFKLKSKTSNFFVKNLKAFYKTKIIRKSFHKSKSTRS